MNIIEMAAELQQLLLVHDKAIKHILDIDSKVCDMNQKSLALLNNEKTSQALQMMLRKSTLEGLREMYKHYRYKKWQEIQSLSKQIMSHLSPDSPPLFSNFPDDENSSDVDERVQHVLKVAMVQNCEFSRTM